MCYSSLDGQYSKLSHQFYTYPMPIKQNCLIGRFGTTILDTKIVHKNLTTTVNKDESMCFKYDSKQKGW